MKKTQFNTYKYKKFNFSATFNIGYIINFMANGVSWGIL